MKRFGRLNLILAVVLVGVLVTQLRVLNDLQHYRDLALATLSPAVQSESITPVDGCTATVAVRWLNQRSEASETSALMGSARRGEIFTVVGANAGRDWLLVNTEAGSVWMAARYMTLADDCENLAGEQNVATAPTAANLPDNRPSRNRSNQSNSASGVTTPTPEPITPAEIAATGSISSIFTPEVQSWASQIVIWASTYQIDPNLIATVMQIESCGNPSAVSSAGAQGLFQVMPFHFAAGEVMQDVETNALRGLTYLKEGLVLANGDVGLALAGYNGGHGVITSRAFASETQRYYYWGSGIYAEASANTGASPTLAEWLAAGGSALCANASRQLSLD